MNQQLDGARAGAGDGVILPDGTRVPMRPILPTDSAALQRFHSRLSGWSIFLRFFHYVRVLTPERADFFTQLDGVDRYARVALDPLRPTELIAVARYDRDLGTTAAEYAIVVADRWQGRGLGPVLTGQVMDAARACGIRRFYAYVLPQNARMLTLFRHLPLRQQSTTADGVQRVEIDLGKDASGEC